MRKRWKLLVYAILLPLALLGGCGLLIATKLKPKPKKPRTAKVELGDVIVSVRETGVIQPIKQVEVKSKVAGQLSYLGVDEGDRVAAGQIIARLAIPETEAQRDQTKAQLDAANARLEQARLTTALNRKTIESQLAQAQAGARAAHSSVAEAESLAVEATRQYENKAHLLEMGGYVSQNEVDSAKAAAEQVQQQVAAAKERLREQEAARDLAEARRAEFQVDQSRIAEAAAAVRQLRDSLTGIESRVADAVIHAPTSGIVIGRHVREGELVTAVSVYGAGDPLVTIGDLSTMLVRVDLNEVDINKVSLGLSAQITADALPGREYSGRITKLSPASAAKNPGEAAGIVRFPLEITITHPEADLRPGMTANVEIVCQQAKDVLWAPNEAIFTEDKAKGKKFVSVVTGTKKTGELETKAREVTAGLSNDFRTEIRSGLKKGEKIELDKADMPKRKTINIGGPHGEGDEGGKE